MGEIKEHTPERSPFNPLKSCARCSVHTKSRLNSAASTALRFFTPWCAAWANVRSVLTIATTNEPRHTDPNEVVHARRRAVSVGLVSWWWGKRKYHDANEPAIVTCTTFLSTCTPQNSMTTKYTARTWPVVLPPKYTRQL